MNKARRKCVLANAGEWVHVEREESDGDYVIYWFEAIIKGSEKFERGELKDVKKIYYNRVDPSLNRFKLRGKYNNELAKPFKSKFMDFEKIKKIYSEGLKRLRTSKKCLADQLLEFGIIVDYDFVEDFEF